MEQEIGKVVHFLPKISVAIIDLTAGELRSGETVTLCGKDGNTFKQVVGSMQLDHKPVDAALAGQSIGMKVDLPVMEHRPVIKG